MEERKNISPIDWCSWQAFSQVLWLGLQAGTLTLQTVHHICWDGLIYNQRKIHILCNNAKGRVLHPAFSQFIPSMC